MNIDKTRLSRFALSSGICMQSGSPGNMQPKAIAFLKSLAYVPPPMEIGSASIGLFGSYHLRYAETKDLTNLESFGT
jgi:hypothetical protein